MSRAEEVWIPLVDEPIGEIVNELQTGDPEIAALVRSPRQILAFRTFAYIRVGILLGQLLVEHELIDTAEGETWVDALLRDPAHRAAVEAAVRAVAEEVAREHAGEDAGPDDEARARFREFARRQLG